MNDEDLLAVLPKYLPVYSWTLTIEETGDGSGDGILELSKELLAYLG